jgi:nucleotide-binding universal stress UspA family protein
MSQAKIIVPIDGSENALRALEVAVTRARAAGRPLHLINVQLPITSGNVRMFVSQDMIHRYHAEEAEKALAGARAMVERAGLPFEAVTRIGHPCDEISGYADPASGDEIIMGSRGMGALGNFLMGSVANKVIQAAKVPVTVVK